jgi:ABC-2 type transport system permease protein
VICALAAVHVFGVPMRGSFGALLALASAFLCPALGLGLVISAATRNQFVASQLALFAGFLPAMLLSGFIFEIASMPAPIRWLTVVIPARYFVSGLQTIFLAGDIWGLLLPAIGAMLAVGLVFLGLTARAMRKRLA